MLSTPLDLCTFAMAIRNGKIISESSFKIMFDFKPVGVNSWIGHGVFKIDKGQEGGVWYGHNGGVLGYGGSVFWSTKMNVAVAVLGNVGSMHAGKVVAASTAIAETDLLQLALRFANGDDD
jgi:D-alanyl-D-alanine carboxypeptidase